MKTFLIKAKIENQEETIAEYKTLIEAEDKLIKLKQEFPQAEYSICVIDLENSNETLQGKVNITPGKPKSPWAFDLDEYLANPEKYKK